MRKYYFNTEQERNTNQAVENINIQEALKEEIFNEKIFLEKEKDMKAEKKEKEIIKESPEIKNDSEVQKDSEIKYFWIRTL